jgi:hypothetical protein
MPQWTLTILAIVPFLEASDASRPCDRVSIVSIGSGSRFCKRQCTNFSTLTNCKHGNSDAADRTTVVSSVRRLLLPLDTLIGLPVDPPSTILRS